MCKKEKIDILIDWINNLDEESLDQLLIEFLDVDPHNLT